MIGTNAWPLLTTHIGLYTKSSKVSLVPPSAIFFFSFFCNPGASSCLHHLALINDSTCFLHILNFNQSLPPRPFEQHQLSLAFLFCYQTQMFIALTQTMSNCLKCSPTEGTVHVFGNQLVNTFAVQSLLFLSSSIANDNNDFNDIIKLDVS